MQSSAHVVHLTLCPVHGAREYAVDPVGIDVDGQRQLPLLSEWRVKKVWAGCAHHSHRHRRQLREVVHVGQVIHGAVPDDIARQAAQKQRLQREGKMLGDERKGVPHQQLTMNITSAATAK